MIHKRIVLKISRSHRYRMTANSGAGFGHIQTGSGPIHKVKSAMAPHDWRPGTENHLTASASKIPTRLGFDWHNE